MKFIIIMAALASLTAGANIKNAPPSFKTETGKAVFVDFSTAHYQVVYDVKTETATVVSTITFTQTETGMPIFDLRETPVEVILDGENVQAKEVNDPDKQTTVLVVQKEAKSAEHSLVVKSVIKRNIKFSSNSVASGFWMSDLTDRKYIEQYLPTNLEYDQYKMTMDVEVANTDVEHEIFTNAAISSKGKNKFSLEFPEYFTTSSVYFHLNKKDNFEREDFVFTSMSGSEVPVTVYSKSAWNMYNIKNKVLAILNELEENFGAWGHPTLTIYIAGMGGMEHSGATITSLRALGHELCHSYFARGVMPINGNSGWLDEAIASWRDDGYDSRKRPFYRSAQMSGFSQYKRTTDRKAYSEGASFMEYLNYELKENGGLTAFLAGLYGNYNHKNISTAMFEKELKIFSGKDFSAAFKRYVFGHGEERANRKGPVLHKENPYHPRLTEKQLMDLL